MRKGNNVNLELKDRIETEMCHVLSKNCVNITNEWKIKCLIIRKEMLTHKNISIYEFTIEHILHFTKQRI